MNRDGNTFASARTRLSQVVTYVHMVRSSGGSGFMLTILPFPALICSDSDSRGSGHLHSLRARSRRGISAKRPK